MLIVSTREHNLNLYETWYSPKHWLRPIIWHDWVYHGSLYKVLGMKRSRLVRRPTTAAVRTLLGGEFQDGYIFREYGGGITLYVRNSDNEPKKLYEVLCCICSVMFNASIR